MISNEVLFFAGFIVFILGMLMLDLGVFSKKSHVVSFREATIWSVTWVTVAIIFYLILRNYGHIIHGIDNQAQLNDVVSKYTSLKEAPPSDPKNYAQNLDNYRKVIALEFITGYLLEYSLSVDNIFVIILIFVSFKVSEKYYKKVLFWGILGAIIMRFLFIFLGSALIQNEVVGKWIFYLFGGFLLYSGVKMFFDGDDDEAIDTQKHPIVRLASRYFSVFPRYVGDRFFIQRYGRIQITPLFVVLLIVEFTDLIFAVDSVPAVFGVTKDPYIVFFSNIFAILGLRSMFFFLSNIMHMFHYLKLGLAFLLIFIGGKMLLHKWLHTIGFENHYSLFVIVLILGGSIGASLAFPVKNKEEGETTEQASV